MRKNNITSIGHHAGNARMIDVKEMLRSALHDEEVAQNDKSLMLLLDTRDGSYDVSFRNAGMSMSEALALIEVAKVVILEDMGYLNCN